MLCNRERANAIMERDGLDALVATVPENVYYLTDYGNQSSFNHAMATAILPRDEAVEPTLLIEEYHIPYVLDQPSWMPGLRIMKGVGAYIAPDFELSPAEAAARDMWATAVDRSVANRQELLLKTLRELGLERRALLFDDVRVMLELRESGLDERTTRWDPNVFREIRVVKTPEEIALLEHASTINQVALEAVASITGEGTTCGELIRLYRSTMESLGGYGSHITGGGRDHPWFAYPDLSYRLKPGDIVLLDPAGWYRRYWADSGRSAHIGPTTQRFEEFYAVLQECMRAVLPHLQPGTTATRVKDEMRAVVRASGVMPEEGFIPLLHSVGVEQYDMPQSLGTYLSDDFAIEAGMVLNVEPVYSEFPWGVLQLEDTYVIDGSAEPRRLGTLSLEPFRR